MTEETKPIRVMLVDDHGVVREGLAAVINMEKDMVVAASVASGEEAVGVYPSARPDVVLLDVRLRGMDGVATLVELRKLDPRARVLMLSSHEGDETIYQSLKAGAVGYVPKSLPSSELLASVRRAVEGKVPLAAEVAVRLAQRVSSPELSAREIEVLRHIAGGSSNKEIADRLGLSPNTVRNHIVSLMGKLGVDDRTQAVTIALARGIIDL